MSDQTIRIGTRSSRLARMQTDRVVARLREVEPDVSIEIVEQKTPGDRRPDDSIHEIPGKGFFTRDLDESLLNGELDLAVHSAKDVPVDSPGGLEVGAFLDRTYPADALVLREGEDLEEIPSGGVVGTSSLRRQAQVLNHRPDLVVEEIRGNVGTRLDKLFYERTVDALILAEAGLRRLDRAGDITRVFSPSSFVPAPGQGAILVQTRRNHTSIREKLDAINDVDTAISVRAERQFVDQMDGGCRIPLGAYCSVEADGSGRFVAVVAHPEGKRMLECRESFSTRDEIDRTVQQVAGDLKRKNASELIELSRKILAERG